MEPFIYNPPKQPVQILHEDDDLIIVAKPAGLLSVPGRAEAHYDCLETRLKQIRPHALLVHRLDMDTSGVMVFAANGRAQRHLGLQFERRHLEKRYEALVWGQPAATGLVDLPLTVDWPNRPLQKVCRETGRAAQTEWEVMGQAAGNARVALFPKTGRSHQLRVHMKEIGHPIIGDRFYATGDGLAGSTRLCLHAVTLRLRHPTGGEWVSFSDPVPF